MTLYSGFKTERLMLIFCAYDLQRRVQLNTMQHEKQGHNFELSFKLMSNVDWELWVKVQTGGKKTMVT